METFEFAGNFQRDQPSGGSFSSVFEVKIFRYQRLVLALNTYGTLKPDIAGPT